MNETSLCIYKILFLFSSFLFVTHVPLIKFHLNTPTGLTWNLEKICVTELGAKPKKRNRMVATVTIVTGSPREVSLAEQGRPHAHAETLPLCQRGSWQLELHPSALFWCRKLSEFLNMAEPWLPCPQRSWTGPGLLSHSSRLYYPWAQALCLYQWNNQLRLAGTDASYHLPCCWMATARIRVTE